MVAGSNRGDRWPLVGVRGEISFPYPCCEPRWGPGRPNVDREIGQAGSEVGVTVMGEVGEHGAVEFVASVKCVVPIHPGDDTALRPLTVCWSCSSASHGERRTPPLAEAALDAMIRR